jgi:hypothetical protein
MENRLAEIEAKIKVNDSLMQELKNNRFQLENEYNAEYERVFEEQTGIHKGDTVAIDGIRYLFCGFGHSKYNRPFKVRKFNKDGKPSKMEIYVYRDKDTTIIKYI